MNELQAGDLKEEIKKNLEESEWLIIVCSPAWNQSEYCPLELDYFLTTHTLDHVLLAFAQGKPEKIIPKRLKQENGGKYDPYGPDFSVENTYTLEQIEAYDSNKVLKKKIDRSICKKMQKEINRLLAPMTGCDLEYLNQRQKARENERKLRISMAVSMVMFVILLGVVLGMIQIKMRDNKIRYQMAQSLTTQSENALASDQRKAAIRYAYQALTKYENNPMPYTPRAQRALYQALSLYPSFSNVRLRNELETKGKILYLYHPLSEDEEQNVRHMRECVAVYDDSGTISVWDTYNCEDYKKQLVMEIPAVLESEQQLVMLDQLDLVYVTEQGVNLVDYYLQTNIAFQMECPPTALYTDGKKVYALCPEKAEDGTERQKLVQLDLEKYRNTLGIETTQTLDETDMVWRDDFSKGVYFVNEKEFIWTKEVNGKSQIWIADFMPKEKNLSQISCGLEYDLDENCQLIDVYSATDELLYLVCRVLDEEGRDVDTKVLCFEKNEKGIYQNKAEVDALGNGYISMHYFEKEDFGGISKTGFLIVTRGRATLVTKGENIRFEFQDMAVATQYRKNSCSILCENGNTLLIIYHEEKIAEDEARFYHAGPMSMALYRGDQLLIHPLQTNRILLYEDEFAKDALEEKTKEQLAGFETSVETLFLHGEEAVKKANELGITKYQMVNAIIWDGKKQYYLVSYASGLKETYRNDTNQPIDSWESQSYNSVDHFLGEGTDGTSYFADGRRGYILSKDGDCVGMINYLYGYNANTNELCVGVMGNVLGEGEQMLYSFFPAYDCEELLKMAEEELEK